MDVSAGILQYILAVLEFVLLAEILLSDIRMYNHFPSCWKKILEGSYYTHLFVNVGFY